MFTLFFFCFTGDLHRDSRHAALWCVLHGLPLHNGEQQCQRYSLTRLCLLVLVYLGFIFIFWFPVPLFVPVHFCFPTSVSCSLSNKHLGDVKKGFVLFKPQPPGPWPLLSSRSPQTYLEGICQKCLVCADTYLSFFLLVACWNTVSPVSTCKLLRKWIGPFCLIRCHSYWQKPKDGQDSSFLGQSTQQCLFKFQGSEVTIRR